MQFTSKIVPCLWFNDTAEAAARFYTSVFPDSRIVEISHYPETGKEIHGHDAGAVLTVEFEVGGQRFTALNGGPMFTFSEAVSFQIMCDSQDEVDHYWAKLCEGGPAQAQQCGWLKDKFGLSWQVVPKRLVEMLTVPDKAKVERTFAAMLKMSKLDIAQLERAFNGQ